MTLIDYNHFGVTRAELMTELKNDGVGSQVHYIPIFLQPYYRQLLGDISAHCPASIDYYHRALSLPMYTGLTDEDCRWVIKSLSRCLKVK